MSLREQSRALSAAFLDLVGDFSFYCDSCNRRLLLVCLEGESPLLFELCFVTFLGELF